MKVRTSPPVDASQLDGVVIGVLMGMDEDGTPLVVFPGNPVDGAVPARTLARLLPGDIGAEVALLFEGGAPGRPLVIGRLLRPDLPPEPRAAPVQVVKDGQRLELTAEREITLRCGKASITLTRAGKVLINGAYVSSRSSGVNKIKGGSVQLN